MDYISAAFQHDIVEFGGSGIPEPPREAVGEHDDQRLIGKIHLPFDRSTAEFGADLSGLHLPFEVRFFGRNAARSLSASRSN
jgi:hypothetical protein